MEIYFYQAECGDAARIRFIGSDGLPHNVFIDAGYERTYQHVLGSQIQSIRKAKEKIDLWIISHIHDDHIGGVLNYTRAVLNGQFDDIVQEWYYNLPRVSVTKLNPADHIISSAKSIGQGDELTNYLCANNYLLATDITTQLNPIDLFGLKVDILSPSPHKLKKLRDKYRDTPHKALEQNELSSISEAKTAKAYDYHIPLESFDLNIWNEDSSVENGSSISVLTAFAEKKILWLADSHPSVVVKALEDLGYSDSNPLVCDWVKVTHHGSKGNNSNALYDMIRCDKYLMSVDGENIHYLPTKECFSRILRNNNRPHTAEYNFYFTYDNKILRSIFKVDGEDVFDKFNFKIHYLTTERFHYFSL